MDNSEARAKKPLLRTWTSFVMAFVLVATAILGAGVISYPASAASLTTQDVDVGLVNHYRNLDYTMDRMETLQRFDGLGIWNKVGAAVIDDSTLICEQNQGVNLTAADWAHLADGNYFEMKARANSTASDGYMKLMDAAGTAYLQIGLGTNAKVQALYTNATGVATTVNVTTAYSANVYYKLSIEFGVDQVTFAAHHENGTLIASSVVTSFDLTYDLVDQILIKQAAATKTLTVDYFFQSSARTSFTPASMKENSARVDPTESKDFVSMKLDFSGANDIPATFSNDPIVHEAMGNTVADTSISNDRYVNLTDFADILGSTKESNAPVVGTAKFKGWQNLHDDSEQQLRQYLAEKHGVGVDTISLIDYYVDDMKVNLTWSASLEDKVKDAWYSSVKSESKAIGAELTYNNGATSASMVPMDVRGTKLDLLKGYEDVRYVYFPSTVTQAQYDAMLKAVSNTVREKTIGCALIAQASYKNVSDPGLFGLTVGMHLSANPVRTGAENFDSSYQFTDAMIGEVLDSKDSADVDMNTVQESQNWTVVQDGKPASTPATTMVLLNAGEVWLIVIVIVIAIIAVVCAVVYGKKRRKVN